MAHHLQYAGMHTFFYSTQNTEKVLYVPQQQWNLRNSRFSGTAVLSTRYQSLEGI